MAITTDFAVLNEWYAVETATDLTARPVRTRLLGQDIELCRTESGEVVVRLVDDGAAHGAALPVREKYGCVWTTLGHPNKEIFDISEAWEADRRFVPCGWVTMRASGLRVVENFLDMAHFPFVHTDILGSEPHTEVPGYLSEIRRDVDEVWATNCKFFQPQAALSATTGIMTDYIYRVMTPFSTVLYKTCPNAANRWDVICLFVQPVDPTRCRAHPVMFLIDDVSTTTALVHFQQLIFLQDRIILENQRPVLFPMEPRAEIPTRADASSIAYRRWLKEKGITYGTSAMAA